MVIVSSASTSSSKNKQKERKRITARKKRISRSVSQRGYTTIDIEELNLPLETAIEKKIQGLRPVSTDCCIYKVPARLRATKKEAYTPQDVSIGPLHHGNPELQAMEEHKLMYLQSFLDRINMSLEDCIEVIKKHEARARNFYAERIELTSDEFVKIVLIDSCFIIEVILRDKANQGNDRTGCTYRPLMNLDMHPDLILLENQIPFFVLDDLYHEAFPQEDKEEFLCSSVNYLSGQILLKDMGDVIDNVMCHISLDVEVKHFLDLLRICHLPSVLRSQPKRRVKSLMQLNTSRLQEAGMAFQRSSGNSLFDIQYTSGLLKIPQIEIYDNAEYLLRNLVALETCHYQHDSYIIDYIFFMDMLLDTAADVNILVQNNIIVQLLGDNSMVATLFNNLRKEAILWEHNYYFYGIVEDMITYCNVPSHKWKGTLARDYCNTPWKTASTIAAIILLLLTFIQTICSVISLKVQG